ncbi:hypothetical protein JNW88_02385 [Micromonospora sp. ATA32]|nr:hypothetical protein [Micromonospora sp. ATA32]
MIKLTVNEVRRLINTFIIRPISDLAHRLRWSPVAAPPSSTSPTSPRHTTAQPRTSTLIPNGGCRITATSTAKVTASQR